MKRWLRRVVFSATEATAQASGDSSLTELVHSSLAQVSDIDADLGWILDEQIRSAPVVHPRITLNIHRLIFDQVRKLKSRPRFFVLVNAFGLGGAELYAASIYRALAEQYGPDAPLFIITDMNRQTARKWLPPEANIVALDELLYALDIESKGIILRHLLAIVRPRAVFNVNSLAFWKSISTYGAAMQKFTDVYSCLFCIDYRSDGARGGYAAFDFRDTLQFHHGILLDNETFRLQLIREFGVPRFLAERMHTLYTPILPINDDDGATTPTKVGGILWAGRFVLQKKPLVAIEVARLCPEFQFHFHGEGDEELTRAMKGRATENVHFHGRFPSMDALLRDGFDLMLYTSLTDGVPTVILGAAKSELPIIASAVGGIPELVTEETGWLVSDVDDPESYAKAVRKAMSSVAEREKRAGAMKLAVSSQHDPAKFGASLRSIIESSQPHDDRR